MNNTINTVHGNFECRPIKGTVTVVVGGLWGPNAIDVIYWTSEDRSSGVHAIYNPQDGTRKLKRIHCTYVDARSRLKYGKQAARSVLTIHRRDTRL